jgi:hypothetical protein
LLGSAGTYERCPTAEGRPQQIGDAALGAGAQSMPFSSSSRSQGLNSFCTLTTSTSGCARSSWSSDTLEIPNHVDLARALQIGEGLK